MILSAFQYVGISKSNSIYTWANDFERVSGQEINRDTGYNNCNKRPEQSD